MSIRIFGSGGGVITDATATPEDVVSGQIFYNNDGRQVGINPSKRIYSIGGVCEAGAHSSLDYRNSSIYPGTGSYDSSSDIYTLTGFNTTYTKYPGFGYPTSVSESQSSTYTTAMYALEIQKPLSSIQSIKAGSTTIIMGLTNASTNKIYIPCQICVGYELSKGGNPRTEQDASVYCGIMIGNSTLYTIIICQRRYIQTGSNFGDYGMYITSDIPVVCYYTD